MDDINCLLIIYDIIAANSKGRSKSEVDLLPTPIHETHNSSPNRHSTGLILGTATANYPISGTSGLNEFHHHHHSHAGIIATTPHSHRHHHYHRGGGHQHSLLGAGGAIPIRASTTTTATTGPVIHQAATAPAHSSMKGRAHNFLTTLVRRRASSNDTSGLGPTAHQISAPKHSHLGVTALSPLGNWINTVGGHHHHQHHAHVHGDQTLQHQQRQQHCHHAHCCQRHRCPHHRPQQRHSLTSLSSNAPFAALVSAPMAHENSTAVPIMGRPLKFKEGLSKGKTPIHINTAAAAALGSSRPNQYYRQSSHQNHNHNPPSASTASSASSSSLSHSSLPSASTLHTVGSTTVRSGSWGPASGAGVVNNGNGGLYSSSSTHMMVATPSSSTSTGFSPHSLRRFASRDAIHRSTSSLSQNQGFGRSTSGSSEGLTSALALASVGGGAAQSEAEGKPSSDPTQLVDMVDAQQDEFQFTESPLPYTPQGQTPPISEPKIMDSRTSVDSLGGRVSSGTTTAASVLTAFPPGIGNLNRPSMDYMSFKPATSSSSSARDSLLQQQRYDPGLSSAGRARRQSGDVRRGRRVDADPDDDDDEVCGNSTEDLARFLAMGPLAMRESHSVMAMEGPVDCHHHYCQHHQHHQHLHLHHGHHSHSHHHHHHHHHHYNHVHPQQHQQYPREDRRPSSGPLPVRNESSSTFSHTSGASTVAHNPPPPSKTAISFLRTETPPSLSRTSTSSSGKQVKRAVSVESFLGQESFLSRVPSVRSKGYGLESALMSTMIAPSPLGLADSCADVCTSPSPAPLCCSNGSIALPTPGVLPDCGVILSDQDKNQIKETDAAATAGANNHAVNAVDPAVDSTNLTKAASTGPVTPAVARTRQESTFVRKSSESQQCCSLEVEDLDVKPMVN